MPVSVFCTFTHSVRKNIGTHSKTHAETMALTEKKKFNVSSKFKNADMTGIYLVS